MTIRIFTIKPNLNLKKILILLVICSIAFLFAQTGEIVENASIAETETVSEIIPFSYNSATNKLIYQAEGVYKEFPGWFSLLPPLVAIILALAFKEVHIALIAGIFIGVFTINGLQIKEIVPTLMHIIDIYIPQSIAWVSDGELQTGHLSIILFSVLIGGMVHVISENGGMQGIVEKVSKLSTSARRTQLATVLMGCLIFFDDYANTLVVGNTMRPLTDKFKISREKLAYIVDSTAAPVAAIAFITTWIGFQLTEIEKGIHGQNLIEINESAYGLFLGSLKYAFYPIFTLFFILILIYTKKDFGAMLKAEQKALNEDFSAQKKEEKKYVSHWLNAAIPILTLIGTVIVGLIITGSSPEIVQNSTSFVAMLRDILSNADSYVALLWASFLACIVAVVLTIVQRRTNVQDSVGFMIEGFKSMVPAVVILILAWTLALVIEHLHTATYISSLIPQQFNMLWLPTIFFIFSALISFATGSSWNTMAVMYPICLPIIIKLGVELDGTEHIELMMPVILNTISVILAASVFGDHCSPISDTTILSSLSSGCDHISHVNTQLPYALTVGIVSLLCGGVLFALGVPWYLLYAIGFAIIIGVVAFWGRKVES